MDCILSDKDKISGYTAIHIHRETQHTRQNVCIALLPLNVMEIKIFLTGITGMSIKHHAKLYKPTRDYCPFKAKNSCSFSMKLPAVSSHGLTRAIRHSVGGVSVHPHPVRL
jgi:hypothetical protein